LVYEKKAKQTDYNEFAGKHCRAIERFKNSLNDVPVPGSNAPVDTDKMGEYFIQIARGSIKKLIIQGKAAV
jgi:hypothetical protein